MFCLLQSHVSCYFLYVLGLLGAREGNSCNSGKVNYCQIRAAGGVNGEHDGIRNNVFLLPGLFISKLVYGCAHLIEIRELLAF